MQTGACGVLLVAPAGAGKGEIRKGLQQQGLLAFETSVLLKEYLVEHPDNIELREALSNDTFASDNVVNSIMFDHLSRCAFSKGVALDGYPRTLGQLGFVIRNFPDINLTPVVVEIVVPVDICVDRIFSGHENGTRKKRPGDNRPTLRKRYSHYFEERGKLLECAHVNGVKVIPIDGTGAKDEVLREVCHSLGMGVTVEA